jgi:hypothetical protein
VLRASERPKFGNRDAARLILRRASTEVDQNPDLRLHEGTRSGRPDVLVIGVGDDGDVLGSIEGLGQRRTGCQELIEDLSPAYRGTRGMRIGLIRFTSQSTNPWAGSQP